MRIPNFDRNGSGKHTDNSPSGTILEEFRMLVSEPSNCGKTMMNCIDTLTTTTKIK